MCMYARPYFPCRENDTIMMMMYAYPLQVYYAVDNCYCLPFLLDWEVATPLAKEDAFVRRLVRVTFPVFSALTSVYDDKIHLIQY